jgi:hypothetical protein
MRLTLRTLLAYMDDILEPAQAKEIGEKIVQSDFASSLSARIKDVLRRRRVTAPEVSGPGSGIDPNAVAEYLDNMLSPEAVADIERIFLESDVHLAEVAGCHQILTLVLGEPVAIPPESRERMYALGPESAKDEQLVAAMDGRTAGGNGAPPAASPPPIAKSRPAETVPARRFEDGLPPQLRRKPFLRRMLPFLIVLLLVGAFVGVVLTDPSLFGTREDDQKSDGQLAQSDSEKTSPVPDKNVAKQPVQQQPKKNDTRIASRGNGEKPSFPHIPDGVNGKPPADVPDPGKGGKVPAGKKPNLVDSKPPVPLSKVAAGKRKPKVVAAKTPQAKAPDVVAGPAPRIQYEIPTGRGLLLRYDAKFRDWLVVAPRSIVHAGDVLAASAPFDSDLDIGTGQCRAVMQGMTAATVLPPNAVATFGFDVRRGRIVLKSGPAEKGRAGNIVIGLKIRGELFRLELLTPGTTCGIEVEPAVPTEFEKIPMKDVYSGGVYVATGAVRLSLGDKNVATIAAVADKSGFLSLKPSDREAIAGPWTTAVQQVDVPDWVTTDVRKRSVAVDRFSTLFLKEFEFDAAPPAKSPLPRISMLENATAIVRDRRPLVSEFAVYALAVTESYRELVRALADAPHEESRRAAIDGLRTWLTMNPKNGPLLKKQIRGVFTEPDADVVYRLLWGFSEKDARDPATSSQLVEWLDHSHVAVRELAFLHVHRLTGRRDGYRPNLLPSQRTIAVNRWRMYVSRRGALLPKKEAVKKKGPARKDDN